MKFLSKTKQAPAPFQQVEEIKVSIRNIRKTITKYKYACKRSYSSVEYILDKEQKIEKLNLILADLNLIIHQR